MRRVIIAQGLATRRGGTELCLGQKDSFSTSHRNQADRTGQGLLKQDVCLWRDLGAVLDEDYEHLRDARNLYRSKGDNDSAELSASLSPELGTG